jgi:hypothetical protein
MDLQGEEERAVYINRLGAAAIDFDGCDYSGTVQTNRAGCFF